MDNTQHETIKLSDDSVAREGDPGSRDIVARGASGGHEGAAGSVRAGERQSELSQLAGARPAPLTTARSAALQDVLDVSARLERLRQWHNEWKEQDLQLARRAEELDPQNAVDKQKSLQIASLRIRARTRLAYEPLELQSEEVDKVGFAYLRRHFKGEWVRRTDEERLLWLHNLLFIMTPDLRALLDKLAFIRGYRALGQQRNLLLGGESGMGKTTILDWYTYHQMQVVEAEYNRATVIKIDAPVNNKSARPLFRRILNQCGATYFPRDDEELLEKVVLYFQKCRVELLIVDEIEQITQHSIKRRLLEISNLVRGVPIICASCHPAQWAEADTEIAGRWNDYFSLQQYTGMRLRQLLAYVELFLPFSQPSLLALAPGIEATEGKSRRKPRGQQQPDIASLIQQWTGGILKDIMVLIMDAAVRAVLNHEPCLTVARLAQAWSNVQSNKVWDFLPPAAALDKERSGGVRTGGAATPHYML